MEDKNVKPNVFVPVSWNKPGVKYVTLQEVINEYFGKEKYKTEDADFEILDNRNCAFDVKRIEDRMKELGHLEDTECEIIEPKQIENKAPLSPCEGRR